MNKALSYFSLMLFLGSCASYKDATKHIVDLPSADVVEPKAHLVQVQGHRGARARFPENTLPAFEYALKVGVDYLELDLQVTQDEQLVVAHDSTVNRELCLTANGKAIPGPVPFFKRTLAEIKTYDCGSIKNAKFPLQQTVPGTKIPTLDEVFEMVKNSKEPAAKKVHFNIETKMSTYANYSPTPSRFAHLLIEKLKQHNMLKRTLIQSFDFRTLMEARVIEPSVRISALFQWNSDFTGIAQGLKTNVISPYMGLLNAGKVERLHAVGALVVSWVANSPQEWKKLLSYNIDGIITDDPEGLIEYLALEEKARAAAPAIPAAAKNP